MKLNKIFIGGLAMLALASCSDYLETDPATNSATDAVVYGSESQIDMALNGVYAKILSDETFGRKLYETFLLNSDVDFASNNNVNATGNSPRRFDVRSDAGNIETLWNNLYAGVETANEFIYGLQNSALYKEDVTETGSQDEDGSVTVIETPTVTSLTQKMGEAKVIRAMFYHELLWYWGDIPFTLESTFSTQNLTPPMTKRQAVSDALIADLRHAAEYMYSDKVLADAPERISKEAAYAMIARLALQAGGYSLNHDENDTRGYKMTRPDNYLEYYQIARDYAKKVIDAQGHTLLNREYRQVFIDECNFIANKGDDPIFEIPFAQATNSTWGYYQGPSSSIDTSSETDYTNYAWGATNGGVRTTAFYRYGFDQLDKRPAYICGWWYYTNKGLPTIRTDYGVHNNKWSKLWNTTGLGKSTTGSTGINFAYIRYADVLLMFAEADNELTTTPSDAAKEALQEVRKRAFDSGDWGDKVTDYTDVTDKDKFRNLVLDERKWEFAGENMRWKDLVRNNMYGEKLLFTFLFYYSVAQESNGTADYMDMVDEWEDIQYSQLFPREVRYVLTENQNNPNFPNNSVYMIYVLNESGTASYSDYSKTPENYFADAGLPYTPVAELNITTPTDDEKELAKRKTAWAMSDSWSKWGDQSIIKDQVLYSLYGYVRAEDSSSSSIRVVDNGVATPFNINGSDIAGTVRRLPAVRYILPYPEEVIARSGGAYRNYYGY